MRKIQRCIFKIPTVHTDSRTKFLRNFYFRIRRTTKADPSLFIMIPVFRTIVIHIIDNQPACCWHIITRGYKRITLFSCKLRQSLSLNMCRYRLCEKIFHANKSRQQQHNNDFNCFHILFVFSLFLAFYKFVGF
jgi:hypothetical protein